MTKEEVALFRYNFKRLLKAKGWDLQELSLESGIGLGTLRKYSAGYREPKPEFRDLLAKTFEVDTSEFYRTSDDLKQATIINESKKIVAERSQKRIDAIAWELNLDMEDPVDKEFLKQILPILPELKKVPVEILDLLTKADAITHNHILEELRLLIEPEPSNPKSKKKKVKGPRPLTILPFEAHKDPLEPKTPPSPRP